jgi:serine acetyltransferase
VRRGATIGAGARVAPGVEIGPYALVGIGAVVVRDVPAHALVLGNPARACVWVCRCAGTLDDLLHCPQCARAFELAADLLTEIQPGR